MSEAMKTAEHRLHLYYGEGKGKTTAAMGLALRALGHGRKVLIAQFMKTGTSGELAALRQVPGARVEVLSPVRGFFSRMSEGEQARTIREQTRQARDLADEINREQPDMIVLDELAVACLNHYSDELSKLMVELARQKDISVSVEGIEAAVHD